MESLTVPITMPTYATTYLLCERLRDLRDMPHSDPQYAPTLELIHWLADDLGKHIAAVIIAGAEAPAKARRY